MPVVLSLNIARQTVPVDYAKTGVTAIGKRPVDGPFEVSPPGPKGSGGSGIHGDLIGDWALRCVFGVAMLRLTTPCAADLLSTVMQTVDTAAPGTSIVEQPA